MDTTIGLVWETNILLLFEGDDVHKPRSKRLRNKGGEDIF